MTHPDHIGYLKSGEAIFKTPDGYGIERDYTLLCEPTVEEEEQIKEIVAKGEAHE
jgi:hypothetical protein